MTPPILPSDPHAEYTRRLADRTAVAADFERRDRSISNLRLVVALIGAGMLLLVLGRGLHPASPLIPGMAGQCRGLEPEKRTFRRRLPPPRTSGYHDPASLAH